jgi:hypothetical protein
MVYGHFDMQLLQGLPSDFTDVFFFLVMVYLFQDNLSHDSDLYNILSMVSLVGVVVSQSITFHLNICFSCGMCAVILCSNTSFRPMSLPSPSVWVPFLGS